MIKKIPRRFPQEFRIFYKDFHRNSSMLQIFLQKFVKILFRKSKKDLFRNFSRNFVKKFNIPKLYRNSSKDFSIGPHRDSFSISSIYYP